MAVYTTEEALGVAHPQGEGEERGGEEEEGGRGRGGAGRL